MVPISGNSNRTRIFLERAPPVIWACRARCQCEAAWILVIHRAFSYRQHCRHGRAEDNSFQPFLRPFRPRLLPRSFAKPAASGGDDQWLPGCIGRASDRFGVGWDVLASRKFGDPGKHSGNEDQGRLGSDPEQLRHLFVIHFRPATARFGCGGAGWTARTAGAVNGASA